ncbi:hypothetical protein C5Y93_21890 [Blastopirellula marina]|uniref:Uncharacterized protein n=1 Tax=Blastopirellula marina TaxID=124 RepID=A0A2S8GHP2_9BACT|nr:hypothetical protein C5Y93_21890 [Blastopirellula marina]
MADKVLSNLVFDHLGFESLRMKRIRVNLKPSSCIISSVLVKSKSLTEVSHFCLSYLEKLPSIGVTQHVHNFIRIFRKLCAAPRLVLKPHRLLFGGNENLIETSCELLWGNKVFRCPS